MVNSAAIRLSSRHSTAGNGTFTNNGGTVSGANGGSTYFIDSATAANGTFTNNGGLVSGINGGFMNFLDSSTAGNGTFTNNGGTVNGAFGGFTAFFNTSTASTGIFTNNGGAVSGASGGVTEFLNTSTAGTGTFTNNGAAVSGASGGVTVFFDSSTAGNGNFTINGGTVSGASGGLTEFCNTSTAANGTFTINGSTVSGALRGIAQFFDSSTAGSGTFTNKGGTVNGALGGRTQFFDTSTAGNANFTDSAASVSGAGGGSVRFNNSSSAGSAMFTNNGAVVSGAFGGFLLFTGTSTAANGTVINNGAAVTGAFNTADLMQFQGSATAAGSTITNNGGTAAGASGGELDFFDTSTAGAATLIANGGTGGGGGGYILFIADSTGGTSQIELNGNGYLDISDHNAPGVTVGSIEGSGNVFLGANNLTVGSNNLSTTFSGVMQDGGDGGGIGGSLTKIGTGTFTLSGANTYTGPTSINAGTLALSGSGSFADSPLITVGIAAGSTAKFDVSAVTGGTYDVPSGQTIKGGGTVVGNISLGSGAILAPGNSPGTLTETGNATYAGGGTYQWEINNATGTKGADPGWDWHNISGTLTIGATSSSQFTIDITGLNTGNTAGVVSNFNKFANYSWIISSAGSISGFAPDEFTLATTNFINNNSINDGSFKITQVGNDLVLQYDAASPLNAYWKGGQNSVWSTNNSGATNWVDAPAGSETNQIPSATSNVFFTANSASNFASTTLGQDFTINSLTFTGAGTSATSSVGIGGSNTLTINATNANGNPAGNGITVQSGSGNHTISSNVALGGDQTWTVTDATNTLTVSGAISDPGTGFILTKAGAGALLLSGDNTFGNGSNNPQNSFVLSQGTLKLGNSSALGGKILVIDGGTTLDSTVANLVMASAPLSQQTWNGDFTFTGTNSLTFGGGQITLGDATSTGSSRTVTVSANTLTMGQDISNGSNGTNSLIKEGAGTLVLSGLNSFTGDLTINAGTLSTYSIGGNAGSPSGIGSGTTINLGNGTLLYTGQGASTNRTINLSASTGTATIDASGTDFTSITFTSDFTATGAGSKTLVLQGSTGFAGEIAGKIVDNLSGTNNTSVTKAGTGTWTLSGANTYSGSTTINGGTLFVNGNQSTATGAVSVNNTGTLLGGTGTIGGAVTVNAGANITGATNGTVGTLTLSSTATFTGISGSLASYLVDLSGATSDRLSLGGALNLSNTFDKITFNGSADGTTTYVLASYSSISGIFDNVTDLPSGYSLSYTGTELDLAPVPVPEPATWIGGALALGVLGWSQRRRFVRLIRGC